MARIADRRPPAPVQKRDDEPAADRREPRPRLGPGLAPSPAAVLALQRAAGNRAVTASLTGRAGANRLLRDAGSDDYHAGYEDGLTGADNAVGPRAGDALTDYQEGFAKGHYEFAQQNGGSSGPADAARLDEQYRGWLAEGDWLHAAESLNGFSRDDILSRLDLRSPEEIAALHYGALANPRLGPGSQIALMTGVDAASAGQSWWQAHKELIWDLAKSKGLIILGEQAGAKLFPSIGGRLGGIIGWALDFATSPGGDTSLPHAAFQAVVMSEGVPVPVPGAEWHRRRENAQHDADAYTASTGTPTVVDEEYSKEPSDPD